MEKRNKVEGGGKHGDFADGGLLSIVRIALVPSYLSKAILYLLRKLTGGEAKMPKISPAAPQAGPPHQPGGGG